MKKLYSILAVAAMTTATNAQIVINEVYGGGGNKGASFKNDFVELVNIGSSEETLSGASLMYASASGTFNSYHSLPDITLAPGQKYLIEMVPSKPSTDGSDIVADYQITKNTSFKDGRVFSGGFSLSANNGKIALVKGNVQITSSTQAEVIDFVGYGSANIFEGSGATPALDAVTSAQRISLTDTNDNKNDFEKKTPTPENKASTLSLTNFTKEKTVFVKNTLVSNGVLNFANGGDVKIFNQNGQVVKSAKVEANSTLDISSLSTGVYIVVGVVNGEKISQKIIKK